MKRLRVAIVGCGNISRAYVETLQPYERVKLVGAMDLDRQRAEALASSFGGKVYPTLDAVLADDSVDAVLNLTIHHAHAEVTARSIEAGKHVHSEKPLALTHREAKELVELALHHGVRLSCAPITFLGEAQQTAWKLIREGRLGSVRVVYAEMNWGRIESWHPAPAPFYEVGPLYDIGVYSLTLLTTFFGPARSALGYGRIVNGKRVAGDGAPFQVVTPDFVVGLVEFANGTIARLTTNFYVARETKQKGIEFHGDLGSLYLESPQRFDAALEVAEFGGRYTPVPLLRLPYRGTEWGRGVAELADAIAEKRPQRATGEQGAHVVEILEAIAVSGTNGRPIQISSDFEPPAPFEWAADDPLPIHDTALR
jgi:predicted dehydrogenase